MQESILRNKRLLATGEEPDVLAVLEEEILEACPDCQFEKATHYREAVEKMVSSTYDLVILDIMIFRGFELLDLAGSRNFPVVMLTTHPDTPELLKRASLQTTARAYLPKDKLGVTVPLLEDVLQFEHLTGWKHLIAKWQEFINPTREAHWLKSEAKIWCSVCRCRHGTI